MSSIFTTPRQFRTQAIVLSRRDFGESDRLLKLFTPDYGKISAVAKGARKPKSKVGGHIELFARSDVPDPQRAQSRYSGPSRTN